MLDDVADITVSGVHATSSRNTEAVITMNGVRGCTVEGATIHGGGKVFVKLAGAQSAGIRIINNNLSGIRAVVTPADRSSGVFFSGNQQ